MNKIYLTQVDQLVYEIPPFGNMRVPGRIYANEQLMSQIHKDNALQQIVNVAALPGIVKHSLGMPDIHWGYGFAIGGVAAMDIENGVISPGGVGYDINCGVRLIRTSLTKAEVKPHLEKVVKGIFRDVPTGVGSHDAIPKLDIKEMRKVTTTGSRWAVENGYGEERDLEFSEERGCMAAADPDNVSAKAFQRGDNQLGTLGSGNHFVEISVVEKIFNPEVAEKLGFFKDQITIMIHSGSRGFGHQICDDYVSQMLQRKEELDFDLPDKQLVSAYISSATGKKYFSAMACAANFAWANRQIIMDLVKKSLLRNLSISESELGFKLIYDVCHNIAKLEEHTVNGQKRMLCVHRKGATRAFAPGSKSIPREYQEIGQPVIIPGDMGRYSYLGVGTEKAMQETFGTTCHGAGRMMSRHEALRTAKYSDVLKDLQQMGIVAVAASKSTLVEEMSQSYKNVEDVVTTMHDAGIVNKVIRYRPIGVIKG